MVEMIDPNTNPNMNNGLFLSLFIIWTLIESELMILSTMFRGEGGGGVE